MSVCGALQKQSLVLSNEESQLMRPVFVSLALLVSLTPLLALRVRVVSRIGIPGTQSRLLLTPDAHELYIATPATQTVVVMETASRRTTHRLRTGEYPAALAVAPDGSHVFVACRDAVVDISTADKSVTIVASSRVEDLTVSRDSRTVYLALGNRGLYKMDVKTHRISLLNAVPLAMALALTPDGRFLYVNYQGSGPGGSAGHDAIGKLDARTGVFLRAVTGLASERWRQAGCFAGRAFRLGQRLGCVLLSRV
jgi:hypothetical protein